MPEMTFIFIYFQAFLMTYLPGRFQHSIIIFAISIITYKQNVIYNTKYIE